MSYKLTVKKSVLGARVTFTSEELQQTLIPVDNLNEAYVTINQPMGVSVGVSADGYEDYGQTIYVDKNITITPELNKYVTLTIVPDPSDAKVVITYMNKQYEQKSLKILANTSVFYAVSKINKQTVSDTVVLNSDKTITVKLGDKIVTDGGIGKYESGATDNISNIRLLSEEELAKLNDEMKSRYVQYDPKLSNFVGVNYTKAMSDALTQIYFMSPIASKISALTDGTLDEANFYFLQLIKQLAPIAEAAHTVGSKIRGIRRAASKVGLGPLIDILTTAFQLIGGLAGLIYAQTNNPGNLIKPYAETFKDIDIKEVIRKTASQTIPQLEYVIDAMEGKPAPSVDVKREIMKELEYIMEVSDDTQECMYAMAELEQQFFFAEDLEESIKYLLLIISTMGTGWAIGDIAELIEKLGIDYEMVRHNFKDNKFSKSLKFTKQSFDKSLTKEKKYIDKQDLEYMNEINKNNNEQQEEYMNGYQDALENSSKGESEEQMESRINKYINECESNGKDYSMYVNGYKSGWKIGSMVYNSRLNNLVTDEQRTSYENGYKAGYDYGKNVRDYAYNYLNIGDIYGVVDIDKHIHDKNDNPIGRIGDDNKVYSFPDENVIGSYDEKNNLLIINNVKYTIEDNFIIEPKENPTNTLNDWINFLNKYTLIMVERSVPEGNNINPYYSKGWKDGYNDRKTENGLITQSMNDNKSGETDGYGYAANNKTTDELKTKLNSVSSIYKRQGIVYGYNDYQSKYNSGYSQGFYTYSDETGAMTKIEFLQQLCTNYGLTYREQMGKTPNERDPVFRGAFEGWDDAGSEDNPIWRNSYYDSV